MASDIKSFNEYHQVRTIRNSKAWMYTFEFWIQGNQVWVEYNNNEPMEFKQILTSKYYPEVKELLQTISEYIKDNSLKYPLLDASLPWPKVIIDFIQKYFKRKDDRMDVIMKSNGDIILNLEESSPYLKPYKSIYSEEISDDYCIDDELKEGIKKKFVIRNGKKVIKYVSTNKQYSVKGTGSKKKLVRKKPSETRKKSIIAKKSARKAKSKQTATNRKRRMSLKKHTW